MVLDSAEVCENARVFGEAHVYGNAQVYGCAEVFGDAKVFGNAEVSGKASVCDYAWVYGAATVSGNTMVFGDVKVYSSAQIPDATSGDKQKPSGAIKHDQNYLEKPPMELLSGRVLEEMAKVLGYGAQKYEPWNWNKGFKYSRLISGVMRHLMAFKRKEDLDPETGLSHLAHAMCGLMILLHHQLAGLGEDDRGEV